jgi:hypothetical protein
LMRSVFCLFIACRSVFWICLKSFFGGAIVLRDWFFDCRICAGQGRTECWPAPGCVLAARAQGCVSWSAPQAQCRCGAAKVLRHCITRPTAAAACRPRASALPPKCSAHAFPASETTRMERFGGRTPSAGPPPVKVRKNIIKRGRLPIVCIESRCARPVL